MPRRTTTPRPGEGVADCWYCGAAAALAQIEAEALLHARAAARGGPFQSFQCPACDTRCGVLRSRARALLYPLEGADETSLIDRLRPRTSREHTRRAREWWVRHAADVERFRLAAARADAEVPTPAEPRAAPARPAATGARAVLGVASDASPEEIRRAYRRGVKRCHPDRTAHLDAEARRAAAEEFKRLRAAYVELRAERSA